MEMAKFSTSAMFFASISDLYIGGDTGAKSKDSNTETNGNNLRSNADSNETVEAITRILNSYALPAVSFQQKAESDSHVFLSAYASVGYVTTHSENENATLSDSVRERRDNILYVPLGVEIGIGIDNIPIAGYLIRSFDLLLAPFDFAYPWQQQNSSAEESFDLEDIWAPSAVLSVGLNKFPIAFGYGYQQTRYDDTRGAYNDREFWFIGIDMPLYRIY